VEAKNQADAVIHSSEKALAEHGDKVGDDEKTAIQTAIDDLKGSLEDGDAETISAKTQTLIQASMKLGEAMYKAQQGEAGDDDSVQQPTDSSDDVVDAEFEEVDGDDKKSA
jgi:molecular chaperone DnaK